MLVRLALAIVSGLALTAAYEPLALAPLLPFAVAGFAIATGGTTVRRAGLVGLVFGVAFYFTHIDWMRRSTGTDAWFGLASVEAVFYGLLGLAVPVLSRLPARPVWLAAGWTAMEAIRSTWPFSGMPWGRLSFAAIDTPVAPAVAYVGMTALSFVLALAGFLLAEAAVGGWRAVRGAAGADRRRPVVAGAVLVGLLAALLLPAVRPFPVERSGDAVVAAVQGNLPGPADNILWDHRQVTRNHVDATVRLGEEVAAGTRPRPDFVLWPENATAVDPFLDTEINAGIEEAVQAVGVPVLVGGLVDGPPGHVLNQGIVWDPVSGPGDRYTKQHPVPYGEYIPFRDIWNPQFGQLALITRDMMSGTRTSPLRIADILVGDAICFDVAYDDVFREQIEEGAELLTVQSSNASFIHTDQIEQQFAITRLRAIEAGRWLVVATPNGRSGVIAPDGTVLATADPRTTAVLVEQVGLVDQVTPGIRLGAWPARVAIGLAVLGLLLGVLVGRRRRAAVRSDPEQDPVTTDGAADEPAADAGPAGPPEDADRGSATVG